MDAQAARHPDADLFAIARTYGLGGWCQLVVVAAGLGSLTLRPTT